MTKMRFESNRSYNIRKNILCLQYIFTKKVESSKTFGKNNRICSLGCLQASEIPTFFFLATPHHKQLTHISRGGFQLNDIFLPSSLCNVFCIIVTHRIKSDLEGSITHVCSRARCTPIGNRLYFTDSQSIWKFAERWLE